MKKDAREFLQRLVESHGAPGYEEGVQKLFRNRIAPVCSEVRTDVLGSVIGVRNPGKKPRILFDGHSDEIGFLVRYIDDTGFLFVAPSGGWDTEVVVSQRVLVHTSKGPLSGVFGKKAIHLMDAEERKKKSELHQLWVDIGAADGEQAKKLVEIGDFVTMDAPFTEVLEGRAVAKSFDNRAGIFVVSETLRGLNKSLKASVYGVSAVQEEIGLRGAKAAAYSIDPDIGIAIDVTHAVDHPDANKRKVGDLRLGKGPVICRGPNINPKVFARLVEVARKKKIPYQVEADGRGTGTDANVIQLTRAGVATGLVSIPLRYMHNPCEMLALEDLDNTVKLLVAFAQSVSSKDDWTPGS
ncbi:MAG: M42 family metallopeptidase [Candidatus Eremiobacteraeota bacterium]|nr:M42 family metallopeptidase [Candidatus Eremiobacteraeota bacterium]